MGDPREDIRIYFDAAVYLNWADGRWTEEYAELKWLLQRGGARLVLSFGHQIDFERGRSADSIGRLSRALVGLPCVYFAMGDELACAERRAVDEYLEMRSEPAIAPDLTLVPYESAACSPDLSFGAVLLGTLAPMFAAAQDQARCTSKAAPVRDPEFERYFANLFDHIGDLLPQLAAVPGLVESIKREVVRRGGNAADLARAIRSGKGEVGDWSWAATRGGQKRWEEVAVKIAPGLALELALRRNKAGDRGRGPLASDLADREHVRLVPYVDVATVDADNLSRLRAALPSVQCRRGVALFTNKQRDVRAALAEIRRLQDSAG